MRRDGVDLAVIFDNAEAAGAIARYSEPIPALLEIDSDNHRAGIAPDDARLVEIAETLGPARLRGVMTHAGGSYDCCGDVALRAMARQERDALVEAATRLEARGLPWVLPPLLKAVERVLVVDNGSTDGTADLAHRIASDENAADRLEVHSYPFAVARCGEEHLSTADTFAVARCGPEHLGTPAASVHSLAYFYNWSFSHVRTGYALKWDADMILTDGGSAALRDLEWQLEASQFVVKIPRYPLYVADERHASRRKRGKPSIDGR